MYSNKRQIERNRHRTRSDREEQRCTVTRDRQRSKHRTRSDRGEERCTVTRDREREINTEQDQIEKETDVQ